MTGTQPKHLDPNGNLRRWTRQSRFTVLDDLDMYRGTVAAGAATNGDIGAIAVGDELGASAGADAFAGSIGQTAAVNGMFVHGRHSCMFTATALSGDPGVACVVGLTIIGETLDGLSATETMSLSTTDVTTQQRPTLNVFRKITSIKVASITGTPSATGFIAIGHGSSAAGTSPNFANRYPMSKKLVTRSNAAGVVVPSELEKLLGPDGLPVAYTSVDYSRNVIIAPAILSAPGEYVLHHNPASDGFL